METLKEDYTTYLDNETIQEGETLIPQEEVEILNNGLVEIIEEVDQNPDYTPPTPKINHEKEIQAVKAEIAKNTQKNTPPTTRERNQEILFEHCGFDNKFSKNLENAFLNTDSYEK